MDLESENLKPMPSAVMAEKSVLSIALRGLPFLMRAKAEGIDAECFYHPQNRAAWLAIVDYQSKFPQAEEVDAGYLIQSLNIDGGLDRIGGAAYIAELWTYAPAPTSFTEWCYMLREMKARRMAKTISTKMDECEDAEEAIACARDSLESLRKVVAGKQRSQTGKAAAEAFMAKFQADHAAGDIPGMSTGIQELDAVSGGMRPGEFWVIGGKPSMGKSVLMLQIAEAFISRGDSAAVFSLEMMESEIIGRLVTVCGRVSYGSIAQPRKATKGDFPRIQQAITKLTEAPLWIDASAGQSIDTIANEAEMIRDRNGGLKLVVVDYLQLIRGNRSRGESREEEVARVSGGLKQLAKRLACPVLSASQLNEEGKTRESRSIEQDADVLIGIFEEGIKIGKMRNGERGRILPLHLNGEMQRFTNYKP
jgi:replicative DNA helicase